MSPWTVIASLIVAGFVVLLVAPTLHRRINARSRETAEADRLARANELRNSADGESRTFDNAAHAVSVRDRLLLRGVRSEVVSEDATTVLIYKSSESRVVDSVLAELGFD